MKLNTTMLELRHILKEKLTIDNGQLTIGAYRVAMRCSIIVNYQLSIIN
jgi:hypothetical protein